MSESTVLKVDKRELTGKKVRKLRAQGIVPGTVYERGKDSINVSVDYVLFSKVWESVGTAQPVELEIGTKKILTMIKDVDVDPAKNMYLHVAFHAINANELVEAEVPVHISGTVPAEMVGNFLVRPNDHVLVSALPANLPEMMIVLAESLKEPGDHVTVADIIPIANVEILDDPEQVLATVEEPRAAEEPEVVDEVEAADVPSDKGSTTAE